MHQVSESNATQHGLCDAAYFALKNIGEQAQMKAENPATPDFTLPAKWTSSMKSGVDTSTPLFQGDL